MRLTAAISKRVDSAKAQLNTLAAAMRHPRTPWYAKALVLLVVAYAVSPVDLIPDPIPVLGLLDDAILLPLGIALAIRMIPADVITECRAAPHRPAARWVRVFGITAVVIVWAGSAALVWRLTR